MSQQEFENYLALLTRLLRISPRQREHLAEEFRSHMEDRLDELVAGGISRDKAIQQALEEFGDAAALASEFVSISRGRRRRWIMRLTTASAAAIVLIAAGIFTFWPGTNAGPGAAAVIAQNPAAGGGQAGGAPPGIDRAALVTTLDDKLNQRIDAEWVETPFKVVVDHLHKMTEITFYVKAKKIDEMGVALDTPVTQNFKQIRLSTLLDLMLEELGLVYAQKDDLVIITTPEDASATMEVRVYDCRDLLAMPTGLPGRPGAVPGGPHGALPQGPDPFAAPAFGAPGGGVPARGAVAPGRSDPFAPADAEPGVSELPSAPRADDPKVVAALEKRCQLEFVKTPLKDVAAFLSAVHRIPFSVDAKTKSTTPISVTFQGVLKDGLKEMLDPYDLEFAIDGTNVIFRDSSAKEAAPVAPANRRPRDEAPRSVPPRTPGDEVLPQAGFGGTGPQPGAAGGGFGGGPMPGGPGGMMGGPGLGGGGFGGDGGPQWHMSVEDLKAEQLMGIVTTAVEPDSWSLMGGPGTIGQYNGLLVVSQSARTHTKVEKVLDMLRDAAGLPRTKQSRVVK